MSPTSRAGTSMIHAGGNRNTTFNQGGGDKKGGLVPTATGQMLSMPYAWRAAMGGLATPGNGRGTGSLKNFTVSTSNQIGGIRRMRSMTQVPSDGVSENSIRLGIDNMLRQQKPNNRHFEKIWLAGKHSPIVFHP